MTRFIWVRDRDKVDHYINVDHIIRVTKIPARGEFSAASYLTLIKDGEISLSQDTYDTADDVITKIQVALA
jgi:hypothetical protein